MLLMSTADIVMLSILGITSLLTLIVGILTLVKKRKVSNKNPRKGGK